MKTNSDLAQDELIVPTGGSGIVDVDKATADKPRFCSAVVQNSSYKFISLTIKTNWCTTTLFTLCSSLPRSLPCLPPFEWWPSMPKMPLPVDSCEVVVMATTAAPKGADAVSFRIAAKMERVDC